MKFYDEDEKKDKITNEENKGAEQNANDKKDKEKIVEKSKTDEKEEQFNEKIKDEIKNNDNKKRKKIIICILSFIVFLILLLICTGFALLNINNSKIMSGVTINGINMKGLSKEETKQKLTEEMQNKLDKEIKLKSDNFEYSIKLNQIEIEYDTEKAIQEAYEVGRNGNILANNFSILKSMISGTDIELDFKYNEKLLDEIISDISVKIPNAVVNTDYYIEGSKLIITKGKPGDSIDKDKLKNEIINKAKNNDSSQIQIDLVYTEPNKIDIDKIYGEVYTEPKDAYYTKEPFEVFPHVNGVDFDIEVAREALKEDKEEYEIELIITEPKITTDKIGTEAFPNLLSSFSTRYDASQVGRSKNLSLAAEKINGTVVMPGETFSYNKTVGERTIAAGYTDAAGYAGGKVVPTLGGGICQISSTLYDAVVYANLEIVERRNHMFLTSYVGAGKDATVVYGSIDFKFKNTRNHPIMINASVKNGIAKIDIYGIKEEVEYEVEISTKILNYITYDVKYETNNSLKSGEERVIQNGMNGAKSITYKILKLNGQEVSRTVLSTDTYDSMNKIIQRGPTRATTTSTKPELAEKDTESKTTNKTNSNSTNKTTTNTNKNTSNSNKNNTLSNEKTNNNKQNKTTSNKTEKTNTSTNKVVKNAE